MDPSPGCYGRAWPACEKGRREFENNPAGWKERKTARKRSARLPAKPFAPGGRWCPGWQRRGAGSSGESRGARAGSGTGGPGGGRGARTGCVRLRSGQKRCKEGLLFCFVFYGTRNSALLMEVLVVCLLSMWRGEGASGSPQLRGSHAISCLVNATGVFEVRKARRGSIC